jgi:hypothetical protein
MRGSFRGVASAGVLAAGVLAALLLVGCSSAATTPPGPSAQSCYAFGVRALERHVTVTAVPAACAGLSPATVNLAVSRAVREVAGPRPKAAERRLAEREGARLAYLIRTVPPARPARQTAPQAGPGSQVPLSVAALVAWLVTAAAGSYLLAGWLRHAGWLRLLMPSRDRARARARGRTGGMPPLIILGHFGLAVAGLGLWIAFMASDVRALAWTAAGLLLPTAGLGMATLVTALPEPAGPESARPESALPESARPEPAGPDPGRLATRIAAPAAPPAPAPQRPQRPQRPRRPRRLPRLPRRPPRRLRRPPRPRRPGSGCRWRSSHCTAHWPPRRCCSCC